MRLDCAEWIVGCPRGYHASDDSRSPPRDDAYTVSRVAAIATSPDPPAGEAPRTNNFDASGSFGPDGAIVTYEWYFSDDGDLTALRYKDWKVIFMEQRAEATFQAWREPFIPLRAPLLFNLRRDPYERAQETSNTYYDWLIDRVYLFVPAQAYVARFLETFQEFPPRQKAASFTIDQVMERLVPPGK